VQLFYLVAPPAGTNTVQVTLSGGAAAMEGGSVSFSGVNQTIPIKNITTSFGSGRTPGVTVASAPGDMVVDALSFGTAIGASTKTIQWLRNQNSNSGGGNGAQSIAAGASSVKMGYTTANSSSRWAMIGMDVAAAPSGIPDITAPFAPTNVSATPVSQSQVNLSWTASTDNVGVTGYTVYRDGAPIGTTALPTYINTGLAASTTYTYTVDAFDAAGNHSVQSASSSTTTQSPPPPDTQAPAISITLPVNGSAVAATVTVSGTASDNVGVVGVQFLLDGANLGAEDTTSPYSVSWNTLTAASGTHALFARARDAAGNMATTGTVTVTVDNQAPTGTIVINGGAAAAKSTAVTLTLSAADALSAVTQMRFSNTGSSYQAAEAYATTKAWTLSTGAGTKTVYVQYKDALGNWSAGLTATIVLDTTAPTISGVSSSNITDQSARVAWTTSEPSTSQVEFGLTIGYGTVTTLDAALVTSHSVLIPNLTASTQYNYRVRSSDAAGNERVGSNNSLTTAAGPPDTVNPSAPDNVAAGAVSATRIDLAWSAATDNVKVSGYKIFRNASQVGTSASTSFSDSTLTPLTSYSYTVSAFDAAGNNSTPSNPANATTLADSVPPNVSLTSPPDGATVYGTTSLSVTVSDDVAVAGVTYAVDGLDIAPEVTTSPFAMSVDTNMFSDGDHVLTARARDTSGNTTTSAATSVHVDNTNPPRTPTLIQHVTTATNVDTLQQGNPFYISLPNRTGAGNALIIAISYPFAAGRTVAVSDDKSNTWVLGATTPANPATNQTVSQIYYALNVTAGTQKVTVSFDAALFNFQADVSEFYNVATVAAADGNSGNSASSAPTVTAGDVTTTSGNDLIYSYAFDTRNTESITAFIAGSGFTLLSADVVLGSVSQYAVQTSPGKVSPAVTVTGGSGDSFNAVALALRSAPAGTPPPPGIRIVHVYHVFDNRAGVALQFPSVGNLLVVNTAFSENQVNISTISSTPSNTWAKLQHADGPQMWYTANAATGQDLRITPTMLQYPGVSFVLYDVAGAATSPYDAAAGTPFTWTSNTNNSDLLSLPVIVPSAPGELIIAIMNDGIGPPLGMVGDGFTLDTITYGGEIDRDNMDNADGYAHYYSSGISPVSFGWRMNSSQLPETSLAMAVGFKAAP
jgi:chitodextrinase